MLVFPSMLVTAAKKAGMPIPPTKNDYEDFEAHKATHPHFFVFCQTQLNRRMEWGEEHSNAVLLASLTYDEIKKLTLQQLIDKGLRYQT